MRNCLKYKRNYDVLCVGSTINNIREGEYATNDRQPQYKQVTRKANFYLKECFITRLVHISIIHNKQNVKLSKKNEHNRKVNIQNIVSV